MELSLQRKTALVIIGLISGVCVLMIIIFGMIRIGGETQSMSLAFQIRASHTIYFLRTKDRSFFLRQFNAIAVKQPSIPEGETYELAQLQSEFGSAWIVSIAQGQTETPLVLSSEESSTLVLSTGDKRLSLGRTPLLKAYIGTHDKEYAWILPSSLQQYHSLAGSLLRAAIHPDASGILVLFETEGRGSVIVSAPHKPAYAPIRATNSFVRTPRFALQLGDPVSLIHTLQEGLLRENSALMEGLNGIVTYKQKEITGSTDHEALLTDLVTGPMEIIITGTGSVAIEGTARTPEVLKARLKDIAGKQSTSTKRVISFMEKENTRIDVVASSGSTLVEIDAYKGWQQFHIEKSLSAMQRGRQYIISADTTLLRQMIDAKENPDAETGQLPSARGTIDFPWMLTTLEEASPELVQGVRDDLFSLIGRLPAQVSWSAKPIALGWMLEWTEE